MRQDNQHEAAEQTAHVAPAPRVDTVDAEETVDVESDVIAERIVALSRATRLRKRLLSLTGVPIVGMVGSLMLLLRTISEAGSVGHSTYQQLFTVSLVANDLAFLALVCCGMPSHIRTLRALAGTHDVRAVGALTDALSSGETANGIVGSALIRLLPRLRREDPLSLTSEQRERLRIGLRHAVNRLMFSRYNPTLAIVILEALQKIGDTEDLATVRMISRRTPKSEDQRAIQLAANACEAVLEARAAGLEPVDSALDNIQDELRHAATPLSTETLESVSALLRKIAGLRARSLKLTAIGALGGTALAFASMASGSVGHGTPPLVAAGLWSSIGIMALFGVRGLYAQRNLTQKLIQFDDLRIVGPLLESAALAEISGTISAVALTSLLPRLKASDAGMLDSRARENLNRAMLNHRANTEFVLAGLKALQQIGDATAIPMVQKLADRAPRSAAGENIREAVRECLPYLQMVAARDQATQTLLRASDRIATPSESLLRPVLHVPDTASEELLRPGSPESDSRDVGSERADNSPFSAFRPPDRQPSSG